MITLIPSCIKNYCIRVKRIITNLILFIYRQYQENVFKTFSNIYFKSNAIHIFGQIKEKEKVLHMREKPVKRRVKRLSNLLKSLYSCILLNSSYEFLNMVFRKAVHQSLFFKP